MPIDIGPPPNANQHDGSRLPRRAIVVTAAVSILALLAAEVRRLLRGRPWSIAGDLHRRGVQICQVHACRWPDDISRPVDDRPQRSAGCVPGDAELARRLACVQAREQALPEDPDTHSRHDPEPGSSGRAGAAHGGVREVHAEPWCARFPRSELAGSAEPTDDHQCGRGLAGARRARRRQDVPAIRGGAITVQQVERALTGT